MANVITNIFKVPDLRKKVLFTFFVLVIYRIGAHIPIPGINVEALQTFFEESTKGAAGGIFNFLDLFAGGALKRFTVFALGIMPYISASIIFQLLTVVIPQFEAMSKEGPEGRKKINKYTKYLTVVLCSFQSFGIAYWLKSIKSIPGKGSIVPNADIGFFIVAIITITTGTMILMWLGEIITEKGIGNGISLIIFSGIVVRLPAAIYETSNKIITKDEPIMAVVLIIAFLGVIAASILLTLGRRNIPIQYGKRQIGSRSTQANAQNLPIPINTSNVIPIIFAMAIMSFPNQIQNMISGGNAGSTMARISRWLSPGQYPYMAMTFLLIMFFCFFYATIVFNPDEVSNNLKKYQGFIPGIRPGSSTAEYLMKVLNRITLSGSMFLALIAITPDIVMRLWKDVIPQSMAYMFGGTSLLIVVGVALDTLKQVESQLLMRHYDGFFKHGKMKGRK